VRARPSRPRHRTTRARARSVRRSQPELNQLEIQEAIQRWQRFEGDTGSSAVQVAVYTTKIQQLARHQSLHRKDTNCKRRLQILVHKRNRMLKYLRRTEPAVYEDVIKAFSIRPNPVFDPSLPKRYPEPTGRKFKGTRGLLQKKGVRLQGSKPPR
jgi:small subunit ribosomal protein S15